LITVGVFRSNNMVKNVATTDITIAVKIERLT